MKYTFPAIFTREEVGFSVFFPDLPETNSQGDTLADAVEMAEDSLAFSLAIRERDQKSIPNPEDQDEIPPHEENQFVVFIHCDTSIYHKQMHISKTYAAIPPGATIRDQLHIRNMTIKEFAHGMQLSEKQCYELLQGKTELTDDIANRLEHFFGIPSDFWLRLEQRYRKSIVKVRKENRSHQSTIKRDSSILTIYPAKFLWGEEEKGYTVIFPDLPGCITEGDTLEQAYEMAQEALSIYLSSEEEHPPASDIKSLQLEEQEQGFFSLIAVNFLE